jgi:hypothetical protein
MLQFQERRRQRRAQAEQQRLLHAHRIKTPRTVAGGIALDAPADFVTTFFNGRKQNRADSLALDALIAAADRRKLADKENSSNSSSKHAAAAQSGSADSSRTRVAHKHDFVRVFPRPAGRAELELMAARNQVNTIHIL